VPRPLSRATSVATAIALIVLPLVALFVKFTAPGWLLVFGLFVSPILAIGYATQMVIAITGYLTPRAALHVTRSHRSVVASWLTGVAAIAVAFFLVDFGDTEPVYSPFTLVLGYADADPGFLGDLSTAISVVAAIVCVGAWIWLVVEWIGALIRRSRQKRAAAAVLVVAPDAPAISS
jgi:hypothetical protein